MYGKIIFPNVDALIAFLSKFTGTSTATFEVTCTNVSRGEYTLQFLGGF